MTWLIFTCAAFVEIAGAYAIWAVLRLGASKLWLIPGVVALVGFAWLLTVPDLGAAGRAYAAYGGIYVAACLVWLWLLERVTPTAWDVAGVLVCLAGTALILLQPRHAG